MKPDHVWSVIMNGPHGKHFGPRAGRIEWLLQSPIFHERLEILHTVAGWKIMAGIRAAGLLVLPVLLKVAIPVFTGHVSGRIAK